MSEQIIIYAGGKCSFSTDGRHECSSSTWTGTILPPSARHVCDHCCAVFAGNDYRTKDVAPEDEITSPDHSTPEPDPQVRTIRTMRSCPEGWSVRWSNGSGYQLWAANGTMVADGYGSGQLEQIITIAWEMIGKAGDAVAASEKALLLAVRFGGIDGEHHKAWVIDQMVRCLAGEGYVQIVAEVCEEDGDPNAHSWNVGVAP